MAIRTKLANKPILDSDDFVTAKLTLIEEIEADESEFEHDSLKFIFESKGTIKNINFSVFTGITVNPDKYNVTSKVQSYNKLTLILIKLGIIKESELSEMTVEDCESILEKLQDLIDSTVKFKLSKSGKNGLAQIDLETLKLA